MVDHENGTALKILLVDDDPIDLTILGAELTRQGYRLRKAKDAEEALSILRNEPVDICISDWSMPGMEGIELCIVAKKILGDAAFYFLLLTANTNKSVHLEAIICGADDVAEKSWDPAVIEARLIIAKRVLELKSKILSKY